MVVMVVVMMIVAPRNHANIEMMMVMMVMIAVVVMVVMPLREFHVSVLAGFILGASCGRRVNRAQHGECIRDWVKQIRE